MKIVTFHSGLGNQVFFYLFFKYLEAKFPNEKIYGYYNKKFLKKHNGLEIHRVFDIEIPPYTLWSNFVAWVCRLLNSAGVKGFRLNDKNYSPKGILFDGYWQDKKYFLDNVSKLNYRNFELDDTNKQLLREMESSESVFIHIRRGDYLAPEDRLPPRPQRAGRPRRLWRRPLCEHRRPYAVHYPLRERPRLCHRSRVARGGDLSYTPAAEHLQRPPGRLRIRQLYLHRAQQYHSLYQTAGCVRLAWRVGGCYCGYRHGKEPDFLVFPECGPRHGF